MAKKKLIKEEEIGPSSRITNTGLSEAEELERNLRQMITKQGIDGISIATEKTPLSTETIFIDPNDRDKSGSLEKDLYMLVICGMNGTADAYTYENEQEAVGGSKSKPIAIDRDLSKEALEEAVLDFIKLYDARLGEVADISSGGSVNSPAVEGVNINEIKKIVRNMTKRKTFIQGTKNINECFNRTKKSLI